MIIMNIRNIVVLAIISNQAVFAANGFLPDASSVVHVGGTDNSATAWDNSQRSFQTIVPWGDDFQSVTFDMQMLQGAISVPLQTPLNRTSSIEVNGGTFDIAFSATGGFERDPLGQPVAPFGTAGSSISFFRYDMTMSVGVTDFTMIHEYDIPWSTFSANFPFEGIGISGTGAVATLQLFDEQNQPVDLSAATWHNGATPTISADGLTATSAAGVNLRLTSFGDGDITDDFVTRAIITAAPATGSTFAAGTQFVYTTNGITPENIPEPSSAMLGILGALSLLYRRRY